MLLGTKKEKQKGNSVSLFFFHPSMTLTDLKVQFRILERRILFFSKHLEIKKKINK